MAFKDLELATPNREEYVSELEYISDLGQAVLDHNKAVCKEIDRTIGNKYVSQSTVDAPKSKSTKMSVRAREEARKGTLVDFLARNPELIGLYDKHGKLVIQMTETELNLLMLLIYSQLQDGAITTKEHMTKMLLLCITNTELLNKMEF